MTQQFGSAVNTQERGAHTRSTDLQDVTPAGLRPEHTASARHFSRTHVHLLSQKAVLNTAQRGATSHSLGWLSFFKRRTIRSAGDDVENQAHHSDTQRHHVTQQLHPWARTNSRRLNALVHRTGGFATAPFTTDKTWRLPTSDHQGYKESSAARPHTGAGMGPNEDRPQQRGGTPKTVPGERPDAKATGRVTPHVNRTQQARPQAGSGFWLLGLGVRG